MEQRYLHLLNHHMRIQCDDCKLFKSVKYVIRFKGKFLCGTCRTKLPGYINQGATKIIIPLPLLIRK